MKIKFLKFSVLVFFLSIFLTGCLTVEKKIYKIKLNSDGSGTMEVKYYNIFSQISEGDSVDEVLAEDLSELIQSYIMSDESLLSGMDSVGVKIVKKDLFEEDGKLCGIVVYEFDHYNRIGIYSVGQKCPLMYEFSGDESYLNSNGDYNQFIDKVIWQKNQRVLTLETYVTEPDEDDVSLLKVWKDNQ